MGNKVLVIEDSPDNMKLICFILEDSGYATIGAETGRKGIDMAITEKPDFIILDIQLPDIDGNEVLRQIRWSETDGNIPIIAMTSYAMSGDREKLLNAGCTGYIEKPIDPETVMEEIDRIIKKNTEHRSQKSE